MRRADRTDGHPLAAVGEPGRPLDQDARGDHLQARRTVAGELNRVAGKDDGAQDPLARPGEKPAGRA